MSNSRLLYEGYKAKYPQYFEIIKVLGQHYFEHQNLNTIYLSIDEDELSELFTDFRGSEDGLTFLINNCLNLLGDLNSTPNFYQNLIDLNDAWIKEANEEFCPTIPFVSLFITVATKMGEDGDIDWRNYYEPLYDSLRLSEFDISRQKADKYFANTFSDGDTAPHELFKGLSDWIDKYFPNSKNSFVPSNNRKHQSWILNQALINSKDMNLLGSFFKYARMEPGIDYDKNQIFIQFQQYLNSHPIKAKSFSKGLRNYIFVDEFKEKITEILKQKFTDWDGEELTIDGFKRIELLHKLQFDFNNQNISKITAEFDVKKIEDFNLDDFDLISSNQDLHIEAWKDETSTICYIDKLDDIYFESLSWKISPQIQKIKIATYDKKIMVFKYIDSEQISIQSQSWKEVSSNESLDSREVYTVVCELSELEVLKNYLIKNSVFRDDEKIQYSLLETNENVAVFRDVRLNANRETTNVSEYLEIFNIKEQDSNKLEITGGLRTDGRNYLSSELPSLIIPQEYLENNSSIMLSINGTTKEYFVDSNDLLLSPNQYLEGFGLKSNNEVSKTVKIIYNSNEEFYDIIEFNIVFPQSINSLHASTLGYNLNINYDLDISWESHYPKVLVGESRDTGYISGGHIKLPKNTASTNSKEEEFSVIDDKLIFLGRRSIDSYQITVDKQRNNWLNEFKNSKNLYLIHPVNKNILNDTFVTYEDYQPFMYLKKEIPIDDITWKAVFNESLISNKIKLFQYGKKLPKRFNEINEDNLREQSLWIDSILEINDLIEKDKVTILGDFDMDLWTNYVNKAEELKGE